ncbi:MAG: hypothetical protein KA053_10930 [Lentimicrobiaceae bacterium]|nr:hypothetical protein [Lentimicrobiaceae bacterium]
MKNLIVLIAILLGASLHAQVPQGIKYQVVVRDAYGIPLENLAVGIRISLLEDSATGVAAYVETHAVMSNAMGLVNLVIGQGSVASGSFAALAWHSHEYHAKVEVDTAGGSSYALLGISQLLTVPYAFHAGSAELPSMTQSQRDAIPNPAQGMQLFNLTTYCVNLYINNHWREMSCTPRLCGDPLLDERDGQEYPTVQIGTQCWMAKNLNIGIMIDGSSNQANNSTIEKYCYNNDVNHCATYGGLYQWDEMMGYTTTPGTQGLCPTGWHVPTDEEWCTLTTNLDPTVGCNVWGFSGTDAGGKMKATGFDYWLSPNTGATNSSGFTALGAGTRYYNGGFGTLRYYACFWSSAEYSSTLGIPRYLSYDGTRVRRDFYFKTSGFSVRCLRN